MSDARRLLILGGIALALLGMSYGLWYAVFSEHQELDSIGKSLATGFIGAAERNGAAAAAALEQYRQEKYHYDRHVDVHGHWIGLAMLLLVLGIAFDRIGYSNGVKYLLALSLLVGSFIFPLGVFMQTYSHGLGPRVAAIAGSALVIVSLVAISLGFAWGKRTS